jgi:hypothetical protein
MIHWEKIDLNLVSINSNYPNYLYYVNLDFFRNWLVGFTIAEGSFNIKKDGSANYQIRQTGIEAYEIIKAICLVITNREANIIKPDKSNSYQLSLSSRKDIQSVIDFFASPLNHELIGYKRTQYLLWLDELLSTKRYQGLKKPIQ